MGTKATLSTAPQFSTLREVKIKIRWSNGSPTDGKIEGFRIVFLLNIFNYLFFCCSKVSGKWRWRSDPSMTLFSPHQSSKMFSTLQDEFTVHCSFSLTAQSRPLSSSWAPSRAIHPPSHCFFWAAPKQKILPSFKFASPLSVSCNMRKQRWEKISEITLITMRWRQGERQLSRLTVQAG